jgi:glycosyltransferase involved in cell wall biosynthesis
MQQPSPSLTICICTIDRPEVLRRCLDAIAAGKRRPDEILVSDDSLDGLPSRMICELYPGVRYIEGPRKGLCANRNVVISAAGGDYVTLLDDDAVVSETFVLRAYEAIRDCSEKIIITGSVIEDGKPVVAANPSFLGYFTDMRVDKRKNVNLNCNVFPKQAFSDATFDENIGYGYEDMDLCSCLVSMGYVIKFDSALTNTHLPPQKAINEKQKRFTQANRARFYTSVKRYLLWEKNLAKLLAFILVAPVHRAVHDAKTKRWYDIPHSVSDMLFAVRTSFREQAKLRT